MSGPNRTTTEVLGTPLAEREAPRLEESFYPISQEQEVYLKADTEVQRPPKESALKSIFSEMLTGSEVPSLEVS